MQHEHASIVRLVHGWFAVMIAVTMIAVWGIGSSALAWERPHSDGNNSGFADVKTKPAGAGSVSVPNIGTFAAAAGPVVARDGTVYLGNQEGEVIALHADGKPYWRRSITPGQSIVASPVIGADGMVYVIGIDTYTDNDVTPPVQRTNSTLHRFTASGGWLGGTPFPEHVGRGAAGAAPNIWNYQGTEVILEPVVYNHNLGGGYDTRLIAFSTSGAVIADTIVATFISTATGGMGWTTDNKYGCLVPPNFVCFLGIAGGEFGSSTGRVIPPPPSVAVFTFAGGGTPFIVVSDHWKDVVGYTLSLQSLSGIEFIETFRVHDDNHYMRSSPVVLPDGHTIIGVEGIKRDDDGGEHPWQGGVIFAGPNMNRLPPNTDPGTTYATPTRLADGRLVLIGGDGTAMSVLQGNQIDVSTRLPGRSIVSAAASRNHFFISAADAFLTYDANTLSEVGRVDWVGGGLNPPAIGPKGYVYAIASNILFVFPAPNSRLTDAGLVPPPQAEITALPAAQAYSPPMTTNGNRLFACLELDGDDCGKGDYTQVSLGWCQKQGFAKVTGYDVDSRKVKAETLDGHFCSKNKCKVFDSIGCAN